MNVKKHAGAQQVMVSLAREEGWVQLSVKDDNGVQSRNRIASNQGTRIVAMEERIHMVAGEWRFSQERARCCRSGSGTLSGA